MTSEQVRDLGRLHRTVSDRKVAGVAGGIARHLDIDPLILRVAFVVLSLFGGAGLIVYAACWILLPEDGQQSPPLGLDERSRSVALILVGILGVALLVGQWDWFWVPGPLILVALVVWLVHVPAQRRRGRGQPRSPAARRAERRPRRRDARAAVGARPGRGPGVRRPRRAAAVERPAADGQAAYEQPSYTQQAYQPPPAAPTYPTHYVAPTPRNPRKRGPILFWFTMALAALAVGVVGIVDVSGAPVAGSTYPAVVVGVVGVMLLVGSFYGRAGGLILVGLAGHRGHRDRGRVGEVATASASRSCPTSSSAGAGASTTTAWGEYVLDLSKVSRPREARRRDHHDDRRGRPSSTWSSPRTWTSP